MSEAVQQFWQNYLKTLPDDHPHHTTGYTAWGFGDGPQMADELGALVLAGTKTATAGLVWDYEAENEPIPKPGDLSIILNGQQQPIALIETTEVTVKPFNTVDAAFAYDEGEGERTVKWWFEAHKHFFTRQCDKAGWTYSDDIPVVFERFRLVYQPTQG